MQNINIGNLITGTISRARESNIYSINLVANQDYIFAVQGLGLRDTTLELCDSNGRRLMFNDDSNGTLNSQINFRTTYSGIYYLVARGYAINTGTYKISAQNSPVDDYVASVSTTGKIDSSSNFIATGSTETIGDRDWFSVELITGVKYKFNINGIGLRDTTLFLRNSNGKELSYNDDFNGLNSQIIYTAKQSGIYYLDAGGYRSNIGTYEIKLQIVDDYEASKLTAGVMDSSNGFFIIGNIETSDDRDWFRIDLIAGNTYRINLDGIGLLDTNLYLLNSTGLQLEYSDNFDGLNSQIIYKATQSGIYYLNVGGSKLNTGTYQLKSQIFDDYSSSTSTVGIITNFNNPITGNIEIGGDRDWFKVDLIAGNTYKINLVGKNLIDSYITLRDASGNPLSLSNTNNLSSEIIYKSTVTGTYYLDAGGTENNTGLYQLLIKSSKTILDHKVWELAQGKVFDIQNNIEKVWQEGIAGSGIDVLIFDTRISSDIHSEVGLISYDYNNYNVSSNKLIHASKVASIIASRDNGKGAVGIAYEANTHSLSVGIEELSTYPDSSLYAFDKYFEKLLQQVEDVDIVNLSISIDGIEAVSRTLLENINNTSFLGRDGLGTIICKAAGNSSSMFTANELINKGSNIITVGNFDLYSNKLATSSNSGEANLITAPGNSTTVSSEYTNNSTTFSGTSAAAPFVAGVCALMLDINPNLGSRDIQEILAYSACLLEPDNNNIPTELYRPILSTTKLLDENGANNYNGGGFMFNPLFGFGMVNPLAAVHLSKYWLVGQDAQTGINHQVVKYDSREFSVINDKLDSEIFTYKFNVTEHLSAEHVKLYLKVDDAQLQNLYATLKSPDGTISEVFYQYDIDNSSKTFFNNIGSSYTSTFDEGSFIEAGIRRFMGEDIYGEWTIEVQRKDSMIVSDGYLSGIKIEFSGGDTTTNDRYVFSDEFITLASQNSSRAIINDTNGGNDTINFAAVIENKIIIDGTNNEFKIGSSEGRFANIENIVGGELDDIVISNSSMKEIYGGYGNDIIDLRNASSECKVFGGDGVDGYIYDEKFDNISLYTNIFNNSFDYNDYLVVLDANNNGYMSKRFNDDGSIAWETIYNYSVMPA